MRPGKGRNRPLFAEQFELWLRAGRPRMLRLNPCQRCCAVPGSLPRLALWLLLGLLPTLAMADDLQARVRTLVEKALPAGSRLTDLDIGQPAARIRDCREPRPYLVHPRRRPVGRVAVGVNCGAADAVLGYLQVRVGAQGRYVVAARRIEAGETLQADMLLSRRGPLEDLPRDSALDAQPLLGRQAARAVARGAVLALKGVREQWLVERNSRVSLRAQGAGFSLGRDGKALDNGNLGSSVRFLGNDGRQLDAQVVGKNELQLRY